MKQFFYFLVACLVPATTYAYDSMECAAYRKKFLVTTRYMVSSTSYFSSTGPCAALGLHSRENKDLFYAQNGLNLQFDIAQGRGPFLTELVSIYGCDKDIALNGLKNNFSKIYSLETPRLGIERTLKKAKCRFL